MEEFGLLTLSQPAVLYLSVSVSLSRLLPSWLLLTVPLLLLLLLLFFCAQSASYNSIPG